MWVFLTCGPWCCFSREKQHQRNRLCVNLSTLSFICTGTHTHIHVHISIYIDIDNIYVYNLSIYLSIYIIHIRSFLKQSRFETSFSTCYYNSNLKLYWNEKMKLRIWIENQASNLKCLNSLETKLWFRRGSFNSRNKGYIELWNKWPQWASVISWKSAF